MQVTLVHAVGDAIPVRFGAAGQLQRCGWPTRERPLLLVIGCAGSVHVLIALWKGNARLMTAGMQLQSPATVGPIGSRSAAKLASYTDDVHDDNTTQWNARQLHPPRLGM
jgi:hypothetical protein